MKAVLSAIHRAPPKPADVPAAVGLAALLAKRWKACGKALRRARRIPSAVAVHDLRVEIRRLLSVLRLVAAAAPDAPQKRLRRTLKRRLKALSRLRDIHVQLGLMAAAARRDPSSRAFSEVLEQERRHLTKRVAHRLRRTDGGRLDRRLARLRRAVEAATRTPRRARRADEAMREAAACAQARVARLRGRADPARLDSLHRLRVALKKSRYMSEALARLHPGAAGGGIAAMRAQQRLLGRIHDLDVLLRRLAEFKCRPNGVHGQPAALAPLQSRRSGLVQEFLGAAPRPGRSAAVTTTAEELD